MARSETPQFLEAGKVAKLLHVSPKTVARWSNEGKLPYVRTLGRHRRYDPRVINALVERLSHVDGGAE
jgi:excisionase family DNA binding protein